MHRALMLLVLLIVPCFDSPAQKLEQYTEEVSVSLTNLYVSVRDQKGRPVYGLKSEDFQLKENGRPVTISNFSSDVTEPVNVVFLLDVSGSMRMQNKFETAKAVIRAVLNRMDPQDEAALLIFADGEVERLIDFTKDKEAMLQRIDKLKPYGGTALRNAVAYCHRLLIHNVGKKGIVLLSDGVDNRSDLTLEQATSSAANVELPVYAFELIRSEWLDDTEHYDELPLHKIAEATGGLYFRLEADEGTGIQEAGAKIFQDLKHQYYIGYSTKAGRGTRAKIELRTSNNKHRVRVRNSVVQ